MLFWSYWGREHLAVCTRYYITITSSIDITLTSFCSLLNQVKKKNSDTLLAMKEVKTKTAARRW